MKFQCALQYSIRIVLVVTAVIAALFAHFINRKAEQFAAIRLLENANARVVYDWQISRNSNRLQWRVSLSRLFGEEHFQQVEAVINLHPSEVTPEVVQALEKLKGLRQIFLYNDPMNQLGVDELSKLKASLESQLLVPVYEFPVAHVQRGMSRRGSLFPAKDIEALKQQQYQLLGALNKSQRRNDNGQCE